MMLALFGALVPWENCRPGISFRHWPRCTLFLPLFVLFLLGQAGCIPHYNNFDGPQDGADKDQVADGGHTDKRSGDAVLDATDIIENTDIVENTEPDDTVDMKDVCVPDCEGQCEPGISIGKATSGRTAVFIG